MTRLRKKIIISAVTGLAVLTAGCGQPSTGQGGEAARIEIVMTEKSSKEFIFEPKQVTVAPAQRIEFVLKNEGKEEHEFEGETAGLEEVVVPPGKERAVAWTAPGKAGSYEIVCDLPDHREKGMVMTVEVR